MRAIAGLKLTAPNYKEAVDILHKRFGDKQQIISQHMDTLLELESVASASNVKALRRLYDQLEFQVRSLKSLEVPMDSYGNLLSSLLINRLPHEIQLLVNREIGDGEWQVDQVMTILEREITARERASVTGTEPRGPPLHTTAAFMIGDGQPKCSYCRQNHSSSSCTVVTDVAQRKGILKRAGRCFVCPRRHHLSRDCRSSTKCTRCNGRHHTSICNSHAGSQSNRTQRVSYSQNYTTATTQPPNPTQPPPTLQLPTSQFGSPTVQPPILQQPQPPSHQQAHIAEQLFTSTTQLYCVKTQVPVLLQTAQAYMTKLNEPNHGTTVRLMLDGGSQRSYMTQRVKDELGLQPEHVEQVQIKTFGSDTSTLQTVEVVRVGISLRTGGTIQVMFSVVPLICEPLACQPIAYTKAKIQSS